MDFQYVRFGGHLISPKLLQEFLPGKDMAWSAQQKFEQLIFPKGELQRLSALGEVARARFKAQVAEFQMTRGRFPAPQQGSNANQELGSAAVWLADRRGRTGILGCK